MGDLDAWDSVADTYASSPQVDWFDSFIDRHLPADLTGRRILDLGCGHGWFASALHERGADVHAVDGSRRLLDIAAERHPGPTYELVDLTDVGITGTYDHVVALMVLMDIPSLDLITPTATRSLVATLLHPAFWNQQTVDDPNVGRGGYRRVTNYLDQEIWRVEGFGGHNHYHRPLGDYVSWIGQRGLGVTELFEPPSSTYDGWRRSIPTRLGIAAHPTDPRS